MCADLELVALTDVAFDDLAADCEEFAEFADPVEYLLAIEDALADGDYADARRLAEAYGDPKLVTKIDWLELDAGEPSEAIGYGDALERLGWSRREARRAHVARFLIGSRRDVKSFGRCRAATHRGGYRRTSRRAGTTPYLAITSAEKRSGKTRLLEVLGLLVWKPLPTANTSDAALRA